MAQTVEVDTERCMCSRECVRVAPEAFEIDEDEMVSRPTSAAAQTDPDVLELAVWSCPVGAISIRQEEAS